MTEEELAEIGEYKNRRGHEPTGFMKRFKETPLMIFGKDPTELAKRWIVYTETYVPVLREYVLYKFRYLNIDEQEAENHVIDFVTRLFSKGKIVNAPTFGYYRFMLAKSIRNFVVNRRKSEMTTAQRIRTALDDMRAAVTRYSGIDLYRIRKGLRTGLVEDILYGRGEIHEFTREQIRSWKLHCIDHLPYRLVAQMCGVTQRVAKYNAKQVGKYVRRHGWELLVELEAI